MTMVRLITRIAAVLAVSSCIAASRLPPAYSYSAATSDAQYKSVNLNNSIKVISLNVAHSRRMGFHQLFQSKKTAVKYLDDVVVMLNREDPDFVALQEVDGASYWSGRFDHVRYLANNANYAQAVRGTHLKSPGLEHGPDKRVSWPR